MAFYKLLAVITPFAKVFFTRPRSLEVVFKVHSCHLSNLDLVMNRFNLLFLFMAEMPEGEKMGGPVGKGGQNLSSPRLK